MAMRYLIILFVNLIICNYSSSQNLDIKIRIDTCIDARLKNKVDFIIENNNDFDCWIKTEFLLFYFGIYSFNGDLVQRKTTRHLNEIGKNEYMKIGKKSKVTIEWSADFFDNYDFKPNEKYYIATSYEYSHLTKDEKKKFKNSDFKLIQSRIDAKSNNFRIFKL